MGGTIEERKGMEVGRCGKMYFMRGNSSTRYCGPSKKTWSWKKWGKRQARRSAWCDGIDKRPKLDKNNVASK